MKICIYGAGAIGGYMGAELARVGADVTLIARGPHLAAMKEKGLTLLIGDEERVAKVRAKIAQRRPYLRTGQDVVSDTVINASTQKTEGEAREGSAMLLERTNMLFRRFAKRHGLDFETAQRLQLAGYRA